MRKMNGFGMMAKRGTAAAMAAAMALTMAGCGGSNAAETTAAADSEAASENGDASEAAASEAKGDIKVGVIQMIDNGAFADMRDGFSEELTEKYTGGKVDIVYKNAQGDAAALNTICQEMADSGVDLIATIATHPGGRRQKTHGSPRQTPFFQVAPHKARSPRFPTDTDESAGRPNTWKMLSVPAESGIQPALPYLSKFPDFSLKASHPPHKMACGSPPCPGEPQPPPVPASIFLPFLLASIFPVHSLPAPKKRKIKPVSYMEAFLS